MPFEISVPEGSAPANSRPHRINPILAKEVEATLNQYLAAGPIQHSTIFEPAGGHPENVRGCEDYGELQESQSNQQA